MEVSSDELRRAVEGLHHCHATFRTVVPVLETFQGQTVWDGTVHVFDLEGHPSAKTCFAWSALVDDASDRRRFYAVLQLPPVLSASDAVRLAVLKDYRDG